jgi:L-rhamnose-H+ transport protein
MGADTLAGLLIVIAGGVMEGAFTYPMKITRQWHWENIWAAGSLAALLLVPWPLAFATVPHLGAVASGSGAKTLLITTLFGIGWGAGSIFFGLGVAALGMSLGLSLIMALIAIGGSLVPLFMQYPEQFGRPAGLVMMAGVAVMIAGVITCATAARMKEKSAAGAAAGGGRVLLGLVYCVLAGLLSPMLNFALIFGSGIADAAVRLGASPASANNAIWALVFTANYGVNVLYCVWLLSKNRTWSKFHAPGTAHYWIGAIVMGLLWAGGVVVYGAGATRMGHFGAFFGFPILLIASILTGNVLGAISGEWSGIGSAPKRVMAAGVAALFVAIVVLGFANTLIG